MHVPSNVQNVSTHLASNKITGLIPLLPRILAKLTFDFAHSYLGALRTSLANQSFSLK